MSSPAVTPSSQLLPYSLVTLDDFLQWANTGQNNPATIEPMANEILNGLTQAVYWAVGRTPPMLTEPTEFTETYNGSGSAVQYLINAPVLSVASLLVNGVAIPASAAYGQAGYFVQQDGKSIAMRSGATTPYPTAGPFGWRQQYCFTRGRGNIQITYSAGYDGCPPDIYLAVLKQATVYLNRRLREDQGSHAIPNSGQTNYRSWAMSPDMLALLQPYTRTAMVNIFV